MMAPSKDNAGSPKVSRVHQRKQMLVCPVAVAQLAVGVTAARTDATPLRQRHRVSAATGQKHDGQAPNASGPSRVGRNPSCTSPCPTWPWLPRPQVLITPSSVKAAR
jgi:hypothetical protein